LLYRQTVELLLTTVDLRFLRQLRNNLLTMGSSHQTVNSDKEEDGETHSLWHHTNGLALARTIDNKVETHGLLDQAAAQALTRDRQGPRALGLGDSHTVGSRHRLGLAKDGQEGQHVEGRGTHLLSNQTIELTLISDHG
jgi:hypothetical protein